MRKSLYQKQIGTLNFCHLLAQKRNLEKNSICSNKFFHIFHLSESSFTCLRLQASGLAGRLLNFSCKTGVCDIFVYICHFLSRSQCPAFNPVKTTRDKHYLTSNLSIII